jgi:hypothetical protein
MGRYSKLITPKYPQIPLDISDIYLYTSQGDRYDILASSLYGDSSLWWIISIANPEFGNDSLIPPLGYQIRVPGPSRVSEILLLYDKLNNVI